MKYFFYSIAVAFVLIAGCKPTKKVQRIESAISKKDTVQATVVEPGDKPVDSLTIVKNIVADLRKNRIDFTTFSAKVKVEYTGTDNSDQATAFIRIKKDSIIWISLRGLLNVEGYRLLVTKDSVKLMNMLSKTIQYRSVSYLQELSKVPLEFKDLQNLIVGNPMFINSNIVSYKTVDNQLLILMIGKLFKHLITLDDQSFRVLHSKLDDVDSLRNRTCDITFDNYEKNGNISFSTQRKITVSEKSKLDVNLNFKQYNFNQPETFPFTVPKSFKKK